MQFWIALDGIDAVGKTTQAQRLYSYFSETKNATLIGEFSSSPVGETISDIIDRKRFFSICDEKKSPITDTLMLITDFAYKSEKQISPDNEIIVSDRGLISLLAYQATRIENRSNLFKEYPRNAFEWLDEVLDTSFSCLPKPDFNIIYTLKPEEINRRAIRRGEAPFKEEDMSFLISVQNHINKKINKNNGVILPIDGMSLDEVTDKTIEIATQQYQKRQAQEITNKIFIMNPMLVGNSRSCRE